MREIPAREEVIPLVEERVEIGKRAVERGRIVVRTHVDIREEIAEAALRQEEVSVERVLIGVPIEAAPEVREEDGVLIVPVLEEQLIVRTQLILKEEIRITRKSRTEVVREPVQLRSERAEVTRLDGRAPDHHDHEPE
jgi:stress response protein YsnF